jgi:hypothetical protein
MCLLCEDEKAYKAYMDYLDAMERQGKSADPNQAMDAAATTMMVSGKDLADTTLSAHYPTAPAPRSSFSCDPVDE